ncbi:hypothetical protein Tco_0466557 [Tanacetum coccineum]
MTRMLYNWILRRKLNPKDDPNRGVSNFTGRIKGMHVFIGNFTYVIDFMIVEDICSIIDPRSSEIHKQNQEIAYKMPHKIEQYNSLSDLEKEHTKSVYLRNEEDKRRGAEYAMRKILGIKAHLLEDKQIPSVEVFDEVSFYIPFQALGWLLEEMHVTWAQLEKKRTRLRLYTNYFEEKHTVRGDGIANYQGIASWISRRCQNEVDLKKP